MATIAYVKHYLTAEGISYFKTQWFPELEQVIKRQPGFISLSYQVNPQEKDCVDIVLKFKDQASLDTFADTPVHDQFVVALDRFRSREYWEAVLTEDNEIDPSKLAWTQIRQ